MKVIKLFSIFIKNSDVNLVNNEYDNINFINYDDTKNQQQQNIYYIQSIYIFMTKKQFLG